MKLTKCSYKYYINTAFRSKHDHHRMCIESLAPVSLMTLIYEFDLEILTICLHTENEV